MISAFCKSPSGQNNDLCDLLGIRPGVTAVAGSGGKTTLLEKLGRELASRGMRTVLCTTTKFRGFPDIPGGRPGSEQQLAECLRKSSLMWAGTQLKNGKWGPSSLPISTIAACADYVIVEADGSAGLPLKAHRQHEPAIPPEADRTIVVLGADGLGKTVSKAAHCPALYAHRGSCSLGSEVTPEIAARVLKAEAIGSMLLINKADSDADMDLAAKLASMTDMPAYAGSLLEDTVCSL